MKCKKNTENINQRVSKTVHGKTMLLSNCAIRGSKRPRFIKKEEDRLDLRTPLSQVPLLDDIFF